MPETPKNRFGKPCRHCTRQGKPCSTHRKTDPIQLGVPSLLTEQRLTTILDLANTCPFLGPVADGSGITRRTLQSWLSQGSDHVEAGKTGTIEARLFLGFQVAKSRMGRGMLGVIAKSALKKESESAARWVGTRLYAEDLTERLHIESESKVTVKGIDEATLALVRELIPEMSAEAQEQFIKGAVQRARAAKQREEPA